MYKYVVPELDESKVLPPYLPYTGIVPNHSLDWNFTEQIPDDNVQTLSLLKVPYVLVGEKVTLPVGILPDMVFVSITFAVHILVLRA